MKAVYRYRFYCDETDSTGKQNTLGTSCTGMASLLHAHSYVLCSDQLG